MSKAQNEASASTLRQAQIEQYWVGGLARKTYLLRKQRKAILENCRRLAVVGASASPDSSSFTSIEKLLGMGLEIIPVFAERESFLGLRCYARLEDVPGRLDIVIVYPNEALDFDELARQAVEKNVDTFWLEPGVAASRKMEELLVAGKVHLVECENFEAEYLKHQPFPSVAPARKERNATKVRERMSKSPATVKPDDALKDAIWKMEHGHFRHLPVVDEHDRLIGILTDRDTRLIRPSLEFMNKEDAAVQLWSIAVQQAAVFDPISVKPETSLREAAELMLRWHVGGLPVTDDHERPVGMITYTDLLREFVGREENH